MGALGAGLRAARGSTSLSLRRAAAISVPAIAGTLALCVLVLLSAASTANAAVLTEKVWAQDGHTSRWRIAGDWSFAPDPGNIGLTSGWERTVPAGAQVVTVPHVWNGDLSEAGFRGTVGWYYARFHVPRGARYRVRFMSTHHQALAFVDGVPVGLHAGGFLAWETLPVHLAPGEHLLAVRADNRKEVTVAQTGGEAWWNWGGLSREVELREAPALDVRSVVQSTKVIGRRSAVVRVVVRVANAAEDIRAGRVRISLAGRSTTSRRIALAPGGERSVTLSLRVFRPRLWSPQRPSLYRLIVLTGPVSHMRRAWTGMVGIRRLVAQKGDLFLNGRRFRARGAALHDHVPGAGAALQPSDLASNLNILRGLHANFTRAHYPLHPRFLELLDRAGIVIWAEAPVIWLSNSQLANPAVRKTALGYFREVIQNQGWHASVGMWSAGNELATGEKAGPGLLGYIDAAGRLARSLDPSRPFAMAFEQRDPAEYEFFCNLVELYGLNYYVGWYTGPPPGDEHRNLVQQQLRDMMSRCPHRPWMVTEFGAEAGFAGTAGERGSFGYQDAFIDSMFRALQAMPTVDGTSIWAGRDFAVTPGWEGGNEVAPRPPINQKGLVTLAGQRKPAYGLVSEWFRRLRARR